VIVLSAIVLSVINSFCHSANRITDKRGNGRRPELADMGTVLGMS